MSRAGRDPRRERAHDLADNGTIKLKYNYKNLIEEVRLKSDNSLVASYKYDAEGRRVEKAVSGGVTERYIRSRAREEEGSHRLANNPGRGGTYDMSHVVTVFDGSNVWKQNFVFNDEIDGIEMLEQADLLDYDTDGNTTETTRSFYHRNALGSVMEITDADQNIAVSYRYDPYGKVTITRGGTPQSSDPLGQHWTFTGRFLDEESGLMYYRARYYDPGTGRFLERDPLGYSQGPGLFAYCAAAPTSNVDPSGLRFHSRYSFSRRPSRPSRPNQAKGRCYDAVWRTADHIWDSTEAVLERAEFGVMIAQDEWLKAHRAISPGASKNVPWLYPKKVWDFVQAGKKKATWDYKLGRLLNLMDWQEKEIRVPLDTWLGLALDECDSRHFAHPQAPPSDGWPLSGGIPGWADNFPRPSGSLRSLWPGSQLHGMGVWSPYSVSWLRG